MSTILSDKTFQQPKGCVVINDSPSFPSITQKQFVNSRTTGRRRRDRISKRRYPYQDICEYIYKNTRSTPWKGSISLIPSSQRPFVGRRVSILNARPEWQNLNTIVQSVSRDLLTGETSLTCGPPAYLGIQDLADLYNNANRTSQSSSDIADTPGGPEPTGSSNSGKRPEAPTIPPMSRTVENATMAWDFTCQVKPYNDEDGNIAGFYVKAPKVNAAGRGWVQTCTDKRDSDGWVLLEGAEITEIYLNVRYKTNSLTELESSSITKEKQYSTDWPVHVGNIPKDSPEWQPDDPPTYSILIATISDDTITIHSCGDIVLYLEVDDTLIANVNGGMLSSTDR